VTTVTRGQFSVFLWVPTGAGHGPIIDIVHRWWTNLRGRPMREPVCEPTQTDIKDETAVTHWENPHLREAERQAYDARTEFATLKPDSRCCRKTAVTNPSANVTP
jgi:hypothetical protein